MIRRYQGQLLSSGRKDRNENGERLVETVRGRSAHQTSANRCEKHGWISACGIFKSDGEAIGLSVHETIAIESEILLRYDARGKMCPFGGEQEELGRAQGDQNPDKSMKLSTWTREGHFMQRDQTRYLAEKNARVRDETTEERPLL